MLAEAQRYSLGIIDSQVRAEAIFDTLRGDDDEIAWVDEHAHDAAIDFEMACANGDYAAACEIAETNLLPTLHDAAAAGRFDRGSTPDEIRARDPHAFRLIATVPRHETRDWLVGGAHAQPAGTALMAPRRSAPLLRPRARGAGRPRAAARTSSRGGDSGDSDSGGSSEGDGEPPPPVLHRVVALLSRLVAAFTPRARRPRRGGRS